MALFSLPSHPEQRFYVRVTIDRGPGLGPMMGLANHWPLTREDAEKLANDERAQSHVKSATIEEATEVLGD